MADLPAQAAQQVLRQLDRAFDNWWNPEHPAGPPIFKKRSNRLTLPLPGQAVKVRTLNHKWADVWLPKLGWIRFRLSRPLGGPARNVTVSRDGLGWHVAFGVATGAKPAPPNGLPGCGVDFGVACSAFVSTEMKPRLMPATLTPGERRRLLGLERRKARQIHWARRHNRGRYSKRVRRTIDQIAKLRARQARGILDNAPAERRSQLAYKAASFGSELRLVLPAGTSQTCAACGIRDPASRPGCGRVFACTSCGQQAHADANAAKVIELIAAGQAVDSTRSRPHKTARPSSRMREPSERRVSAAPGNLPPEGGRGCQGVFGSSQRLVMSGLEIHGENRHCFTRDDQKYVCRS
jgi:putative transposase